MNWNGKDIETYLQEKDYIDTAVIPMLPIAFDSGMRRAAEQGEIIQLISQQLERQFKGRMLVLPPFTYVTDPDKANLLLQEWEKNIKESGFTFIFLLTADKRWKQLQRVEKSMLINIPAVPLQHMDEVQKESLLEEKLKSIMLDVIDGWQSSE